MKINHKYMIHLHNTTNTQSIQKVCKDKLKKDYQRLFFVNHIFQHFPLELIQLIFMFSHKFITMNVDLAHIVINADETHIFHKKKHAKLYDRHIINKMNPHEIKQMFVRENCIVLLAFNDEVKVWDHSHKDIIAIFSNIKSILISNESNTYYTLKSIIHLYMFNRDMISGFNYETSYSPFKIKSVAFGLSHRICLIENNYMCVLGNNEYGQLGIGSVADDVQSEVQLGTNLMFVDCGDYFSIALSINNELYGCGRNINHELGLGDTNIRTVFTLINIFELKKEEKIIYLECSCTGVVALSNHGYVWKWGSFINSVTKYPEKIQYLENVMSITLKNDCMLYITRDETFGKAYL